MATGKQQNLLVPLIISIVVTVAASVTAFLFYQKMTKLDTELQTARKSADEAGKNRATAETNLRLAKELIGYPEAEFGTKDDAAGGTSLVSKIREDLSKYIEPSTTPSATYRDELARLAGSRDNRNQELEAKTLAYNQLMAAFQTARKEAEEKVNVHDTNFRQSEETRQNIQTEVDRKLAEAERQRRDRELEAQKEASDRKQVQSDYENYQKKSETTISSLKQQVTQYKEGVQQLQSAGTPVGAVVSVDNLNNEVYIDRGHADLLPLQATFSIWAPDKAGTMHWKEKNEKIKADVRKEFDESGRRNVLEPRLEGGPKAYIEISAILGSHQAKGKITMENRLDPITPGDYLFSPIWAPGQRKRFALAGRFDMTGTGTDDRALLIGLIKRQGGAIDAEVKSDGTREGAIAVGTHYLVIGDMPDESEGIGTEQQKDAATRVKKESDEMMKEAKSLGIEIIDQHKLYDFMGYKPRASKYETGSYGGGPTPRNRFETPASSRPTALPRYESGTTTRSSTVPGSSNKKR